MAGSDDTAFRLAYLAIANKKAQPVRAGLLMLLDSLPNTAMTLWGLRLVMAGYLLAERRYRMLFKKPRRLTEAYLYLRPQLKTDTAPYPLIVANWLQDVNTFMQLSLF